MKTIFIKNVEFRKKQLVVLLEFPFDFELKELVKTLKGADWNPSLKAWTIPYSDSVLPDLLTFFKGLAWLDYSGFKKMKIETEPEALPPLAPELTLEIQHFTDWMRNRRYSESTINNYTGGLGLFFRFVENKNPEQITKEDLESFHKNYIISRKYSASFQSLVINAVKLYFSNQLKRKLEPIEIERPKQPRLLPHVLRRSESHPPSPSKCETPCDAESNLCLWTETRRASESQTY